MHRRYYIVIAVLAALLCLAGCKEIVMVPTTVPTATTSAVTEPATEATQPQETIIGDGVISGVDLEDEEETEPTVPKKEEEEPKETTAPTEDQESEETTAPTSPEESTQTYKAYMDMSADEQAAFIASFESVDAFMSWFNKAKAEYDSTDGSIDIGSGSVDLEDIIGKNP